MIRLNSRKVTRGFVCVMLVGCVCAFNAVAQGNISRPSRVNSGGSVL